MGAAAVLQAASPWQSAINHWIPSMRFGKPEPDSRISSARSSTRKNSPPKSPARSTSSTPPAISRSSGAISPMLSATATARTRAATPPSTRFSCPVSSSSGNTSPFPRSRPSSRSATASVSCVSSRCAPATRFPTRTHLGLQEPAGSRWSRPPFRVFRQAPRHPRPARQGRCHHGCQFRRSAAPAHATWEVEGADGKWN